MIKILNNAKFPLNICRGTSEQRIHSAIKLNEELFNNLSKEFYRPTISVDTFTKSLKSVLKGNKIDFKIKNSEIYNCNGACARDFNWKNQTKEVCGYSIYLPINDYDNSLSINDIGTLMHETLHFFIGLLSPKHTTRDAKCFDIDLYKKTESFYNKFIYSSKYTPENLKENLLPKILNTLTPEEKINFLQATRYRLKEEMHCFLDGSIYDYKIKNIHKKFFENPEYKPDGNSFRFPKKITILEQELAKTLKDVRENMAKSKNL